MHSDNQYGNIARGALLTRISVNENNMNFRLSCCGCAMTWCILTRTVNDQSLSIVNIRLNAFNDAEKARAAGCLVTVRLDPSSRRPR